MLKYYFSPVKFQELKKRVIHLVGARPQFIKAAALHKVMRERYAHSVEEILVHSGQHYDYLMSEVFFKELGLPEPRFHLDVGQGTQAEQTGKMMVELEKLLVQTAPDMLIVYGDTNTTLAGALVAAKLNVPIAHVEAGLRSYNNLMPEELNRVITDRLSTWLFAPTSSAVQNLVKEGISHHEKCFAGSPAVIVCGDIMLDSLRLFSDKAKKPGSIGEFNDSEPFVLITLHRNFNADDRVKLNQLIRTFCKLCPNMNVIFPVHPRTHKSLNQEDLPGNLIVMEPVSYFEMMWLEMHSTLIATDSGGIQKEAFFFKKPLIILRNETEWTELAEAGVAMIAGDREDKIHDAIKLFLDFDYPQLPDFYGNGHAAEIICETLFEA